MSAEGNELPGEQSIKKTLWIFEYTRGDVSGGSLHLFYAAHEQEACTYVGDYIKRAAARGERLTFRHLQTAAGGFCTGYTQWRGSIHVRPDGTAVEGSYRCPIVRVAYKGEDAEQGHVEDEREGVRR